MPGASRSPESGDGGGRSETIGELRKERRPRVAPPSLLSRVDADGAKVPRDDDAGQVLGAARARGRRRSLDLHPMRGLLPHLLSLFGRLPRPHLLR
jgi:hypothetical protein